MNIYKTITNNVTISALIVGLLTTSTNLAYQWYLRPRIILDTSGYYAKVGKEILGDIQVANLGRNVEKGMTVRIETAISNKDDITVLINRVPTQQTVVSESDFTDVIIDKLYPDDNALISFKPKDSNTTTFSVSHFGRNMRTSRYENLQWTAEWWELNETQRTALTLIIILAILTGVWLEKSQLPETIYQNCLRKNNRSKKY
jgi:hypothetical protein